MIPDSIGTGQISITFPRIRGGDPCMPGTSLGSWILFPAHAGVIPTCPDCHPSQTAFPRIRGGDSGKVRRCTGKTNRPGFRSRKPGRFWGYSTKVQAAMVRTTAACLSIERIQRAKCKFIAVCVFHAQATSANGISQICRFNRHYL